MGENPAEFNKIKRRAYGYFVFNMQSDYPSLEIDLLSLKMNNIEHFSLGKRSLQNYLISFEGADILREMFGWHLETDFHVF